MFLSRAKVWENEEVAGGCFSLTLQDERLARESRPGQFVHIRLGAGPVPFLRRPFSIAGASPARGLVQIIFRLRGMGTKILSGVCRGDELDCLGPLGNGFRAGEELKTSVLLGGGVGVAPLLFLAKTLREAGKEVLLYYGAPGEPELLPVERYLFPGVEVNLATEDGSKGFKGFVTDLYGSHLRRGLLPQELFACGPRPMMQKIAGMHRGKGVYMQFSLEERMACGIGACQGCPVEITDGENGTVFKRVCRDGPVFNPREVVW